MRPGIYTIWKWFGDWMESFMEPLAAIQCTDKYTWTYHLLTTQNLEISLYRGKSRIWHETDSEQCFPKILKNLGPAGLQYTDFSLMWEWRERENLKALMWLQGPTHKWCPPSHVSSNFARRRALSKKRRKWNTWYVFLSVLVYAI